ncbi:hypothetical protein ACKKBG_A24340 [Auxenochlorella protothecoides x Auxenochlorella symbiontica]
MEALGEVWVRTALVDCLVSLASRIVVLRSRAPLRHHARLPPSLHELHATRLSALHAGCRRCSSERQGDTHAGESLRALCRGHAWSPSFHTPAPAAFVEFEDARDADDAIRKLDGFQGWRVELSRGPRGDGPARRGGFGGGGGRLYGRDLSPPRGLRSPSPLRRRGSPVYEPARGRGSPSYEPVRGRRSPSYEPVMRRRSPSYEPVARRRSPSYEPVARRRSPSPRRRRDSRSPVRRARSRSPLPARQRSPYP